MSQNPLPVEDLSNEGTAPVEAGEGALGLHARLQTAFASTDDVTPIHAAPALNAMDASRSLAAAALRQGQAFENFQGAVRENVRDLCEALLQITLQTKTMSADAENRFASLSDAMAVLSGHVASQRQEVQANIAATDQLCAQLKQLQDEIAGQRAEAAQIKALILSTGQSLRNDLEALQDQVTPLTGKLEAESQRAGAIETRIAALPDMEANIAALNGHVEELESDTASLTDCITDLEPLKASVARLAAEDTKLVERFASLADDLDTAKSQVAGLEDTVAALADSSIRSSESLSVLGNTLDAAKTQIFSLNQTSEYLTERLRIAEQVVERFTRREKILAGLHARAARTLQLGQ